MSLVDRLKRLDDRVVPDRAKGKYDAPPPMWFVFSGLIGAIAGGAFIIGLEQGHGAVRLVVCVVAASTFATEVVAVLRWGRTHRIGRPRVG